MYDSDKNWISTNCVAEFHFLTPKSSEIHIEDIATSLSRKCRFNGYGDFFYSVAEHSVLVSRIIRDITQDPLTSLAGLLHDVEEAYWPDISSPQKSLFSSYPELVSPVNRVIVSMFKLELADWELVKDIDTRICTTEAKALGLWNESWNPTKPLGVTILGLNPSQAKEMFLNRLLILQDVLNA